MSKKINKLLPLEGIYKFIWTEDFAFFTSIFWLKFAEWIHSAPFSAKNWGKKS